MISLPAQLWSAFTYGGRISLAKWTIKSEFNPCVDFNETDVNDGEPCKVIEWSGKRIDAAVERIKGGNLTLEVRDH